MSILDGLNERIARHRNRDFLKAAMAAGALAAQADGTVTLSERYRIDDILARLERLRIYDPHKAVQILDGFLTELRDNAEAAERVLLGKLRRIAEDREAAELVVRIALSVSESDGAFSAPERARFEEICAVLGFSPERFLGERRTGDRRRPRCSNVSLRGWRCRSGAMVGTSLVSQGRRERRYLPPSSRPLFRQLDHFRRRLPGRLHDRADALGRLP
ncbi:MAG: tellurite resistance TerB family protein [Proteobacteria bacterium]|nr:tellurite resistance TerB family protein [Pseudomonadota bacterium]